MQDNELRYPSDIIIIQAIFLLLRIFKVVKWAWIWVFSPTWVTIIFTIIIFITCTIYELRHKDDDYDEENNICI